jgi:hypothetical protein
MCRLRLGLKAPALAWLEAARAWQNHRPGQKPKVGLGLARLWPEPRLLGGTINIGEKNVKYYIIIYINYINSKSTRDRDLLVVVEW